MTTSCSDAGGSLEDIPAKREKAHVFPQTNIGGWERGPEPQFPRTHIGVPNAMVVSPPRQFKESNSSFEDLEEEYLEMSTEGPKSC